MAGIANIGSFASGLMRGHLTATEEQRREEDQAFQKEQRGQTREEWERAAGIRRGIAALPAAGSTQTRRVLADYGKADNDYQDQFRDEQYTYTPEMRQQDLSGLYRRFGQEEQAVGAEERIFALGQQNRTLRQQSAVDAALARRQELHKKAKADPVGFMVEYGQGEFNADRLGGPRFAGHTVAMASTPNGQVGYMINPQGQTVGSIPITSEAISRFIDSLTDDELSAASPEMYSQVAGRGLQRRQLGATEMTAEAALKRAGTEDEYRRFLQNKPTLMQGGDGRLYAFGPQANLLGTYGNPRPVPGSAMAELRDPKAYAAAVDRYNALAEQFATETNPAKRADLIARMNVVEIQMSNAAGRPAQIRGTSAPRPDISFKDFVATFAGSPSGQMDRRTGKPVLFGDLPPEQQLAAYQRIMGAGSGAQGGLPDAPPPSSGVTRQGATTPEAAPAPDTTRYIREKSPRGGYIYTPSPRGMTKAQYAEIDNPSGK